MKIIGINSRYDSLMREVYSGSCALIIDGKIVYALAEDRISRKKDDGGFEKSLNFILKRVGLRIKDIDYFYISFYGNALIPKKEIIDYHLNLLDLNKTPEKLVVMPSHHFSHACASYFLSPFDEAIIMVADNEGNLLLPTSEQEKNVENYYCERNSYFWARGNCITLLERDFEQPGEVGFGKAYNMFNYYIGFGNYLTAGKTMGLSSYGKLQGNLKKADLWRMDNHGKLFSNIMETSGLIKDVEKFLSLNNIKVPPRGGKELYLLPEYQNLARFVQEQLNKWSYFKIKHLIKKVNLKNICISGGVALNGVMNEFIERKTGLPVFVPPYPSDPGQALGNAIYGYISQTGKSNNSFIEKFFFDNYAYLGSEYSNDEIAIILKKEHKHFGINFEYAKDIEIRVAELIAQDAIVGWFQGRSEYGARALGNRSIIASPKNTFIRNKVNKLKGRESFRPLAPTVLSEFKNKYFSGKPDSLLNKYMLGVNRVKNNVTQNIKGVVHIDKTSRLQEVSSKDNERFYRLIKEFYKITKIPMVLNTSFNVAGEPIVESPIDALKIFMAMELDYLVLGNFLIQKGKVEGYINK